MGPVLLDSSGEIVMPKSGWVASYTIGRFVLSSFVASGDSDEAEAGRDAGAA